MKTLFYFLALILIVTSCEKEETEMQYPKLDAYYGHTLTAGDYVELTIKEYWTFTSGSVDSSYYSFLFDKSLNWSESLTGNHITKNGKPDSICLIIKRQTNDGTPISVSMYNCDKENKYQYLNISTTKDMAVIRGQLLYDYPYFIKTYESK